MTSRTRDLYKNVFQRLRELVPETLPESLMCDFEAPMRRGFIDCFGNDRRVNGCYFHYSQAVLKKVNKLGLSPVYRQSESVRDTVRKLLVLPLLNPTQILQAFTLIQSENADTLGRLFTYFRIQWLERVGPEGISVNGLPDRTNNGMEGVNSYLLSKIGAKPGFWEFCRKLTNVVRKYNADIIHFENGMNIRRLASRNLISKSRTILSFSNRLESGQITVAQFLNRAKNVISSYVNERLAIVDVQPDEDEADILDVIEADGQSSGSFSAPTPGIDDAQTAGHVTQSSIPLSTQSPNIRSARGLGSAAQSSGMVEGQSSGSLNEQAPGIQGHSTQSSRMMNGQSLNPPSAQTPRIDDAQTTGHVNQSSIHGARGLGNAAQSSGMVEGQSSGSLNEQAPGIQGHSTQSSRMMNGQSLNPPSAQTPRIDDAQTTGHVNQSSIRGAQGLGNAAQSSGMVEGQSSGFLNVQTLDHGATSPNVPFAEGTLGQLPYLTEQNEADDYLPDLLADDEFPIVEVTDPVVRQIQSWSVETSINLTCPICLNSPGEKLVINCGHGGFHKQCLINWMNVSKLCPVCRADIYTATRLFFTI